MAAAERTKACSAAVFLLKRLSPVSEPTKLVLDEIDKSTEGFAWWEAKMPSEISKTAQENVQPLLNGEMTGEEYMQSIQDVYDMQ